MRPRLALPLPVVLVGAGLANSFLALLLAQRGGSKAALLACLPLLIVLFGKLVASNRTVFLAAALGLSMTISSLQNPLPLPGGQLYGSDLVVILAFVTWLCRRWASPAALRPSIPRSPLFGPPLILFAGATLWAAIRGHYAYGANILGEPVRLVIYSLLVFALVDLNARTVYRTIVAVFYAGTVWMFCNALYLFASGKSQTDQINLSTGGTRTLALSTAIYLAGGLFLALLNLEVDTATKRRALLALAGIIVSYGRATYLSVALVLPVLFVFLPRVRRAFVSMLPICLPFLLLLAIAIPRLAPSVVPTFSNRVFKSNASDVNVEWRQAAASAIWQQVHRSPIDGVGFGEKATFRFAGVPVTINQDPHDSFLFLLAGGGILTLGAFLLLMLTFAIDAARRLKRATDPYQRLIVLWSGALLFAFLVNAAAGPVLSDPRMLLTIWAVMLLPSATDSKRPMSARPALQQTVAPTVA
jgi:hypothetical protein